MSSLCEVCGDYANVVCKGCGVAEYCDAECQQLGWAAVYGNHRAECEQLASMSASQVEALDHVHPLIEDLEKACKTMINTGIGDDEDAALIGFLKGLRKKRGKKRRKQKRKAGCVQQCGRDGVCISRCKKDTKKCEKRCPKGSSGKSCRRTCRESGGQGMRGYADDVDVDDRQAFSQRGSRRGLDDVENADQGEFDEDDEDDLN